MEPDRKVAFVTGAGSGIRRATARTVGVLGPVMAEAAVDISSRPVDYTGQVELSYQLLDRIGRPTMTLDGTNVFKNRPAKEASVVR